MNWIEKVRRMAIEENLDPDKVEEDLRATANLTGFTAEEIAESFLMAIHWRGPVHLNWPEEWRQQQEDMEV